MVNIYYGSLYKLKYISINITITFSKSKMYTFWLFIHPKLLTATYRIYLYKLYKLMENLSKPIKKSLFQYILESV